MDDFKTLVRKLAKGATTTTIEKRNVTDHAKQRIYLLKSLVVSTPALLQKLHPDELPGMVFKYFDNYLEMVLGELQLLDGVIKDPASTVFTFVGAGFPLTGILLHILTGGASINLVDCDQDAVSNLCTFLKITDALAITDASAFRVIHGRGENLIYQSTDYSANNSDDDGRSQSETIPGMRIKTDVLDIASAVSSDSTQIIMRKNATKVKFVRKRNVYGMSELLYEKFAPTQKDIYPFKLTGVVLPPHACVSENVPLHLFKGFMSPININSCHLYVNMLLTQ